jgi:hypothetical protein
MEFLLFRPIEKEKVEAPLAKRKAFNFAHT